MADWYPFTQRYQCDGLGRAELLSKCCCRYLVFDKSSRRRLNSTADIGWVLSCTSLLYGSQASSQLPMLSPNPCPCCAGSLITLHLGGVTMPKPKATCSLRTICRRSRVPRRHADALFLEILEASLWGQAVAVPRMGKFWLQPFPSRRVAMPIRKGARKTRVVEARPGYTLRFTSSQLLRDYLRRRVTGRARGTA